MTFLFLEKIIPMDEGKFNILSMNERANIVWRQGEFLDSVIYGNYCLMLYSVKRQFVEMYIDLKSHSIVSISLANEYDLTKYLDGIQLEVGLAKENKKSSPKR
ncbi:MAG: hypothetical protein WEB30_18830 [Cyclobacteriaceae bacterium]